MVFGWCRGPRNTDPACHVAANDVRDMGADKAIAETDRVALNVHEEQMTKVRPEIKWIKIRVGPEYPSPGATA
jgi:hypothetical protein